MFRFLHVVTIASLSAFCCGAAMAETMRCQSVNGNLNCAGSDAVSCQTVNGKTVCTSGKGDIVQSFGDHRPSTTLGSRDGGHDDADKDDDGDEAPAAPPGRTRLRQNGPSGHALQLDRDGRELHLRTDRMSIDRN